MHAPAVLVGPVLILLPLCRRVPQWWTMLKKTKSEQFRKYKPVHGSTYITPVPLREQIQSNSKSLYGYTGSPLNINAVILTALLCECRDFKVQLGYSNSGAVRLHDLTVHILNNRNDAHLSTALELTGAQATRNTIQIQLLQNRIRCHMY